MSHRIYHKIIEGKILEIVNNKLCASAVRFLKALNRATNRLFKKLDQGFCYFPRRRLSRSTKIEPDTIMFLTYQGDYTCNPRAIAEEIIRQQLPYKLFWVVKKETNRDSFPPQINLVLRGSYEFYKAAASARIFIDNTHDLPRLGVHKKNGQILFQTWHGSLGIKRLDGDIVMNRRWKWLSKVCQEETDYCISNSTFENEVFQTSYWPGVPTLPYGHARNDILFTTDSVKLTEIRQKVCSALNIRPEQKVLLYAPTHRDKVNESFSGLDYAGLKHALEERFSGEWVIALRFHSRLKKQYTRWLKNLPPYVADATDYDDIQELMVATDAGLTDYSSWIFDYILLQRPGFILADDIDTFAKNRSFYYPLESTPFPIASDDSELLENIRNFDEEKYHQETVAFLEARGCFEDGHASERTVEKIREIIEEKTV